MQIEIVARGDDHACLRAQEYLSDRNIPFTRTSAAPGQDTQFVLVTLDGSRSLIGDLAALRQVMS